MSGARSVNGACTDRRPTGRRGDPPPHPRGPGRAPGDTGPARLVAALADAVTAVLGEHVRERTLGTLAGVPDGRGGAAGVPARPRCAIRCRAVPGRARRLDRGPGRTEDRLP
ncbi:hypothetical protein GCM10010421_62390 [Streptomyces glaucus]|uniref:Secreted protein n=1 Tax=Streptomyces glaucus TaxID=284029 RepID=A0ABP5XMN0_9ACTN